MGSEHTAIIYATCKEDEWDTFVHKLSRYMRRVNTLENIEYPHPVCIYTPSVSNYRDWWFFGDKIAFDKGIVYKKITRELNPSFLLIIHSRKGSLADFVEKNGMRGMSLFNWHDEGDDSISVSEVGGESYGISYYDIGYEETREEHVREIIKGYTEQTLNSGLA